MKKQGYTLYDVRKIETIEEMLFIAREEAPDKIAFRYKTGEEITDISYGQFVSDTLAFRHALADFGISSEHVACAGESRYEWVTAYLGTLSSDCVFVPIDKELPKSDLVNVLLHSDSAVLFCSEAIENTVRDNLEALSGIKKFICFDRKESSDDGRFIPYSEFIARGKELLKAAGGTAPAIPHGDVNALKMLVYTSGTTGMAKGVMLSEHNVVSCTYYGLQVSTIYDTCLSVLPWHHTYEAVAGLLVALHKHSTICINDKIRNVLKNLQTFRPSYIYLVPAFAETFYKRIWQTAEKTGEAGKMRTGIRLSNALRHIGIDIRPKLFAKIHNQFGGRLHKIVCGGAPIRPEIGEFFDSIGIPLINGYGITECSPLVSVNPDSFNDWSTTGIPLPCVKITIEDPDEDGNGEICVKGDIVMLGYYKNPEETEAVLKNGVFHTGDYGRVNEKGQLLITGRKKNLIVLDNGKNIYPEEIEGYILSIPYVTEAVVYGVKNGSGSEIALCAEVYPDPEATEGLDGKAIYEKLKDDIREVCADLPIYKRIAKIVIRDTEFEKTTSNKIRRSSATGM